ncbi:hypothetical protein F442_12249 [Phytophthora nicotianae P10297]|nr:hypothetical protein L915_12054 [Phytophthora nicotianae]ETL35967.1 hypothetical protein L916_11978 [Phytophthora nicotianae]ETP40417.1 hypothetical protein F442_12249 [Phytophthora nicotianae P10297]
MQLFLRPNFKIFDGFLKRIIQLCNADLTGAATAAGDQHFTKIRKTIYDKVRSIMVAVAAPGDTNASRPETILEFWERQAETGTYKFLPLVARVLFAIPSSSAQIERDFGIAGQLVTPQRGSIAPQNVDMPAFLNCNRQFVDVTQCPKIHPRDIDKFIPSNVNVGMEEDDGEGCELLGGYFSSDDDEDIDDTVA